MHLEESCSPSQKEPGVPATPSELLSLRFCVVCKRLGVNVKTVLPTTFSAPSPLTSPPSSRSSPQKVNIKLPFGEAPLLSFFLTSFFFFLSLKRYQTLEQIHPHTMMASKYLKIMLVSMRGFLCFRLNQIRSLCDISQASLYPANPPWRSHLELSRVT